MPHYALAYAVLKLQASARGAGSAVHHAVPLYRHCPRAVNWDM